MKAMFYILWYVCKRYVFVLSKRTKLGKGVAEIAKLLGVHLGSVSRWLTNGDGMDRGLLRNAGDRAQIGFSSILKSVKHRPLNIVMSICSGPVSVLGKLSALN
jgi:hypothetical protein